MRSVVIVLTVVAAACGLPAKLGDPAAPHSSPLLVKELADVRILVSEPREGEYGVQVYQQATHTPLPTQTYTLPPGWLLPGKEESRVVHAELLSSGDVVVVFFSLEHGLDLVLLPSELFTTTTTTPSSRPIVFPEVSVPWHPTVSTPSGEEWPWPASDSETVTPSTLPHLPKPEKVAKPH